MISVSKGLELTSRRRMTEIIRDECEGAVAGVLTGPNLAKEIMAGFAAASVLAFDDDDVTADIQEALHTLFFEFIETLMWSVASYAECSRTSSRLQPA